MCTCNIESPKFYQEKLVIARKNHVCCECGATVNAGSKYQKVNGMWGGNILTYKTCLGCVNLFGAFGDAGAFDDQCRQFGNGIETCIEYAHENMAGQTNGLLFRAYRHKVKGMREATERAKNNRIKL